MTKLKQKLIEELTKKGAFGFYSDKDVSVIADFLIHQGVENTNEDTMKRVMDYHIESSDEDMFNWIHSGGDESPYEIKNAPYVDEMSNVLVLEDGSCILWEEIGLYLEPFNPYNENDYESEDIER